METDIILLEQTNETAVLVSERVGCLNCKGLDFCSATLSKSLRLAVLPKPYLSGDLAGMQMGKRYKISWLQAGLSVAHRLYGLPLIILVLVAGIGVMAGSELSSGLQITVVLLTVAVIYGFVWRSIYRIKPSLLLS